MVIDNQIPKTETVYEIKEEYKVPSFEEFMQSYENNSNLNYDDLNSSDISETKGYGPCQICNKTEQWTYLYLSCPGVNDSGVPCGNPNKTYWYHSGDGGKAQISNRAKIRCSQCYLSDHMSYWSFLCSKHEGGKYYSTRKMEFRKALTMIIGTEEYIGTTMADDIITYISHPDHRNEGRSGW